MYLILMIIWFCDKESVTRLALFLFVCTVWQKTNVPAVAATNFGNHVRIHLQMPQYIYQMSEYTDTMPEYIYQMTEYIDTMTEYSYQM